MPAGREPGTKPHAAGNQISCGGREEVAQLHLLATTQRVPARGGLHQALNQHSGRERAFGLRPARRGKVARQRLGHTRGELSTELRTGTPTAEWWVPSP